MLRARQLHLSRLVPNARNYVQQVFDCIIINRLSGDGEDIDMPRSTDTLGLD